ncbi:MAG: hypothetical protein ACI9HK_004729 [Pirellulaceae bacterium]|jgi:hypothetical protein
MNSQGHESNAKNRKTVGKGIATVAVGILIAAAGCQDEGQLENASEDGENTSDLIMGETGDKLKGGRSLTGTVEEAGRVIDETEEEAGDEIEDAVDRVKKSVK